MVQNVNFSSMSQNSNLSFKLNSSYWHKFRGMLGLQNRAAYIKILKFHINWDNSTYLENQNFQWNSFANSESRSSLES